MTMTQTLGSLGHLTFKGNLKQTRYGWLRLTPAYSVHLVAELLQAAQLPGDAVALDPFCGTGTTALVCAERGIACDTTDINPFLIWLAGVKTRIYAPSDITAFRDAANEVAAAATRLGADEWKPALFQIEKWWPDVTLTCLARMMRCLHELAPTLPESAVDLLKIAFCRAMIDQSNASFGHQSMSFKKTSDAPMMDMLYGEELRVLDSWASAVSAIGLSAMSSIRCEPHPLLCDARALDTALPTNHYACVITSPPYPNRMSYIRELRPYMYWLGYLTDARSAGELDWQAIGGTWGIATSKVGRWTPDSPTEIPFSGFADIIERIGASSLVLSRYVQKYFYDIVDHVRALFPVMRPGGTVHYIVGNSKFYDVLLPVEEMYRSLFDAAGFEDCRVHAIRKRTSKKELFEYVVSARKPPL